MARRKADWLIELLSELRAGQLDLNRRVAELEGENHGIPWRAFLPYFYGAAGLAFGVMVATGKVPPQIMASLFKGSSH